ncbi:MAG: hypothetical protein D6753_18545, partial [Planctomycetota bacterium]
YQLDALTDGVETLPLKVMYPNGTVERPESTGGDEIDAFAAELTSAAESIQTGNIDPRLDGQHARDAIHICQCLQQAADSGSWVACS